jgi:hypothetical protein
MCDEFQNTRHFLGTEFYNSHAEEYVNEKSFAFINILINKIHQSTVRTNFTVRIGFVCSQ